MSFNKPIIIFDGVCVLCSFLMKFVLWADSKTQRLQYATAQSAIGQAELVKYDIDKEDFETVLLVLPNGSSAIKMNVVIEVGRILGGFWKTLYIFKILPQSVRNGLYDFIASRRYKWFGKSEYCERIPDKYKDRIIQ